MKISDIHTHILYGIDDGAYNCEMSMELIRMEYEQGVRDIFLTNHSYGVEWQPEDYHSRFNTIRALVREKYPDLSLYKGCEVLCNQNRMSELIERIRTNELPSLNGTKYVLMEFNPHATRGMAEMSYCLKYALEEDFIPVIAHAERYKAIYDDPLEDLRSLKEMGCMVQINLYSVEQDRGFVGGGSRKELANLFLYNRLVDFVGTDTHRVNYKSPEAAIGAAVIRARYDEEYADQVLYKNAEKYLIR